MKQMMKVLAVLLLAAMLLAGCGTKPVYEVSGEKDNSISVTAVNCDEGSVGIGYLTVGEKEAVVVAANFDDNGKLRVRMYKGVLGEDELGDDFISETTVSGHDTASFTTEAGEYTAAVFADSKLNGTAKLSVRSAGK